MSPNQGATLGPVDPTAVPQPSKRANPTALDAIFILLTSVTLLLLLFWIVSQVGGGSLFKDLPLWLTKPISSVWTGSGTALSLILRKWLDKEPAPNYLVWILGFLAVLLVAVFLAAMIMAYIGTHPVISVTPDKKPIVYPSIIRLKVEAPSADVGKVLRVDDKLQIRFQERNPLANDVTLAAQAKDDYTFSYKSSYKMPPGGNVVARFNWVRTTAKLSSGQVFDYEICLKPDFQPAIINELTMLLECAGNVCKSAKTDPHLMVGCDLTGLHLLPLAYAFDTKATTGPQRWVVPSLETLQKIPSNERVGYTHFEIEYQPSAVAQTADLFYYEIFVNNQPVYIDGFPPDSLIEKFVPNKNLIKFALENLNFSGQYEGNEKIRLVLVVLKRGKVILRQELERDYVALRDAAPVVVQNQAGKFIWSGTYVKPKNENRYEVFVSSTKDPKLAMNAKAQFEKANVYFHGNPTVMVIRPPLDNNVSYGLVLGTVQPTAQVKFTFSKEEALAMCKWANGQNDLIRKKRLIRTDLILYDNSIKRGYTGCH